MLTIPDLGGRLGVSKSLTQWPWMSVEHHNVPADSLPVNTFFRFYVSLLAPPFHSGRHEIPFLGLLQIAFQGRIFSWHLRGKTTQPNREA